MNYGKRILLFKFLQKKHPRNFGVFEEIEHDPVFTGSQNGMIRPFHMTAKNNYKHIKLVEIISF
ncbi:MAG: hypothetical protein C0433_01030 [Cyclobacterium sp.]|nr:hypothetical protein [Cyclobacterium sp.]